MLVVRVGAMGDVLHALPAVQALREQRPDLRIGWVVDSRWAPLLVGPGESGGPSALGGCGPVVDRVHLAETRLWSQAPWSGRTRHSVLALRQELQATRYHAAIDMQGTLRSAVLGRFAGAARFAGYRHPRETAACWLYRQPLPRLGGHVVEQGAALLGAALGIPLLPARSLHLPVLPEAEAWAAELISSPFRPKPLALLAPTAGWGAKQWPAARFGALAAALADRGWAVRVNAAHEAEPIALAVVAASGGAARLVCGGVAGLVALTGRAALVVGGDSGPVHLAAALGTPVVALFGPTDPARNGPRGAGPIRVLRHPNSVTTYKRSAPSEAGLARLEVGTVLEAALAIGRA